MLAVMVMLALGGCRKASESGPRGAEGGPAGPTRSWGSWRGEGMGLVEAVD